jgi:hypothetical protein
MADFLGGSTAGNFGGNISCGDNCEAWKEMTNKYLEDVAKPQLAFQTILSTLVGVYALVKQHQLMKEYLKLAKRQVVIAEEYLQLAKDHYHSISVPTWKCQKMLFDRYVSGFAPYETEYLSDAFRLKEYSPEYKAQEGRAIATVQAMFDKARLQRLRQNGKYNRGRACFDSTYFAIMQAQAKVAAVNHAYRFEENRKFKLDQWYWQRRTQGVAVVSDMGNRVVGGLNGGAGVANQGLGLVGDAVGRVQGAFGFVENGYTNLANFWGGLANTAFQFAGYSYGRSQAMPFSGGMGGSGIMGGSGSGLGGVMSNSMYSPMGGGYGGSAVLSGFGR